MNINELLNRKLSFEEMNNILNELMGYSCNDPLDSSEVFHVYDDANNICDFRKHIGTKALNTLSGILFFKENIDEERGKQIGKSMIQQSIKQVLGIN